MKSFSINLQTRLLCTVLRLHFTRTYFRPNPIIMLEYSKAGLMWFVHLTGGLASLTMIYFANVNQVKRLKCVKPKVYFWHPDSLLCYQYFSWFKHPMQSSAIKGSNLERNFPNLFLNGSKFQYFRKFFCFPFFYLSLPK